MRILNIRYKNINSLAGEGRIYFDQGPIAEAGVFAITGPNGSGKTSILDVITLGLYGETFRFDKPAEHVMTKQTDESVASVEFSLGGEKFRSDWYARRAEGDKQSRAETEMSLTKLGESDELLAETPSTVRGRIAELTGMDFHKFSKSMVLPQGDFAAFLNALDSERMDILEKIAGGDIYEQYRQQAEAHYRQIADRVRQLQQDSAAIPLLEEAELDASRADLRDFLDQHTELSGQQDYLRQHQLKLENVAALEAEERQLARQTAELQTQMQTLQSDLQRIAAIDDVDSYREQLAGLDAKQSKIGELQSELASLRREVASLRQQLGVGGSDLDPPAGDRDWASQKRIIDDIKIRLSELKLELPRELAAVEAAQQTLADKRAALTELEGWLQEHRSEAILLTDFPDVVQLRNLRTEIAELGAKQKTQLAWSKNTSAALKKNQTALTDAKAGLVELQERIAAAEANIATHGQGRSVDEIRELLSEQQARVNDFQELYSLASVNAKVTKKGLFGWLSTNKSSEFPDEGELRDKLAALKHEFGREENIGSALEQAIANEALLRKMTPDRGKLVDGKPCFLCGSLHHPYTSKPPVMTDSKKALVDQRGKMQALKAAMANIEAQLTAAEKRSSQMSAKERRLQEMRAQWRVLVNRLNVARDGMAIENLSLQKQCLDQETEELEKIKLLLKDVGQWQRNIGKWTDEIGVKQAQILKLAAVVEQLETAWNNRPPEAIEGEQQLAALKASEKALLDKLEKALMPLGEKIPGKSKENALFDRLNVRRQDYQIRDLRKQGVLADINGLQDGLQSGQARIIRYQAEIAELTEALQNHELSGLHLALFEKQTSIADLEVRLSELEADYEVDHDQLLQRLLAGGFSDLDSLRAVLAQWDSRAEMSGKLVQLEQRLAALNVELAELDLRLQKAYAALPGPDTAADLLAMQRALSEKIDITEHEIRSLEHKLAKQQTYAETFGELQEQLRRELAAFAEAEAELNLINHEQGGMRRRIQQLLVEKLLRQANRILEGLSGRYYLRNGFSEYGLALEVEDTKQINVRRLPKTLSGGESFVVSLALALALSEIANNGRAIDSLFLDEGFGNLDAEALYLAMTTLESLKTQGKIVGVISHVDAVKKRIKTQIELVKNTNGFSELKMVA